MLKVFIGWDRNEVLPWHVLCHSIISRASSPVSISPVKLSHLPLTRTAEGSTEFSISRFLVPWLCGYRGLALFIDCDMLVNCDVADIFDLYDGHAVNVVKHDYTPSGSVKFYGNKQVAYPRKNWSSVMLMDCGKCTALTQQYVDTATAMDLHRFSWLRDDQIGDLPIEMNHLVGEYKDIPKPKVIHWTNGGPWLEKYGETAYAALWHKEHGRMSHFRDE